MLSVNPTTGETLAEYEEHDAAEIERRVLAARSAQRDWRDAPFERREDLLRHLAAELRASRDENARLMALEMGKPVVQAEAEVEKCARTCEHYAANARALLSPVSVPTEARASAVHFVPLGVVLAVMPWNFPFWQLFRCAVPAIAAGNAVVLKHASNVPGCALAIERVFTRAGAPDGLFATLLAGSGGVPSLIAHPAIAAVSLTGSEAAGVAVAREAGRSLKKCVLELGGSDAFVVLGDADLEAAVATAVTARVQNNGQSCIAAKRFIVEQPLVADFERRMAPRMAKLIVDDPLDRATDVGPLARGDLRDELHALVERSIALGARVLCGARARPGPGFFYEPTVLAGVTPDMPVFEEETFGPVAAITPARDA
jgi:succinate-semialdehyde dehydrogenase/glutarate-semialdehyde dehydrogenase